MNSELLKNKDLDVYYILKLVPKDQYTHFALIQALEEADLDASTLSGRRRPWLYLLRPSMLSYVGVILEGSEQFEV